MFEILGGLESFSIWNSSNKAVQISKPKVGTHWPHTPWEIYDFVSGFLIGTYGPLISRAYANDCFSAFFGLGTFVMGSANYFDKKW